MALTGEKNAVASFNKQFDRTMSGMRGERGRVVFRLIQE